MSIIQYFDEIESFEFGAQFSVFSGFRLVLSDMAENETLQELIGELRSDRHKPVALFKRVRFLLRQSQTDDEMAFDGSLAAYLYCLWKSDLEIGYLSGQDILNTPDLWWSAKLALLVRQEYWAEQISSSVHFTSEIGEPIPYPLAGREYESLENPGPYTYFLGTTAASRHIALGFEYQQYSNCRVEIRNDSTELLGGRLVYQDVSNPLQEFEMSSASLEVI